MGCLKIKFLTLVGKSMRDNRDRSSIGARLGANTMYLSAVFWALVLCIVGAPQAAHAAIAYVQGAYETAATGTAVTVTYSSAQKAGDLNVVVMAWVSSTVTVQSVTDSMGNTYVAGGTATVDSGVGAQQIYYAKNIKSAAANSNTVTITFNTAISDSDIRIVEYSGVDPVNAFDGGIGASGTGTAQNSGSLTTTNANDVLVAGNFIDGENTAVGTGFTLRLTTGYDEIVEDEIVTAIGNYSATATQNSTGYWMMQMAAFKAAAAPTISSFTPSSGPVGTVITITGTNLSGATSPGWIGSAHDAAVANVNSTTVTLTVPSDAPVAADQLTVFTGGGSVSSGQNFTVTTAGAPTIASFSPASGPVGTVITVTGTNLGGSTAAWVGSAHDAGVTNVSSTEIQMTVPADAPVAGDQLSIITPGGQVWSGQNFTVTSGGDTTPPTTPGTPSLTVASASQINLSWAASTDNVGVTGYFIQSCSGASCSNFAQIASVGGSVTTYNNTGLSQSTSYSYKVQATDAAGNLSSFSGIATATTSAGGDTQPPSNPTNLTATPGPMDTVLAWTASTDNVGVTGYFIERCEGVSCTSFAQIATVSGSTTTYTDSGVTADASYSYRVRATDAAGNLSGYSTVTSDTPLDCD